jgi:hypothetical protein
MRKERPLCAGSSVLAPRSDSALSTAAASEPDISCEHLEGGALGFACVTQPVLDFVNSSMPCQFKSRSRLDVVFWARCKCEYDSLLVVGVLVSGTKIGRRPTFQVQQQTLRREINRSDNLMLIDATRNQVRCRHCHRQRDRRWLCCCAQTAARRSERGRKCWAGKLTS